MIQVSNEQSCIHETKYLRVNSIKIMLFRRTTVVHDPY